MNILTGLDSEQHPYVKYRVKHTYHGSVTEVALPDQTIWNFTPHSLLSSFPLSLTRILFFNLSSLYQLMRKSGEGRVLSFVLRRKHLVHRSHQKYIYRMNKWMHDYQCYYCYRHYYWQDSECFCIIFKANRE